MNQYNKIYVRLPLWTRRFFCDPPFYVQYNESHLKYKNLNIETIMLSIKNIGK